MKAAVIVFPGSNCDRDLAVALSQSGIDVSMVWHKETELPDGIDLVGLPGGFSHGDYLRCGAIAARAPIMSAVADHVKRGGYCLGICNGFRVLIEAGLLPGALMRNAGLKFVCRSVRLKVHQGSEFTSGYGEEREISLPVAHHDGNYTVTDDDLARLGDEGRVAFRYDEPVNGSIGDIAGVLSANKRVLGMMPHPERAADPALGSSDGRPIFDALARGLVDA